MYRHIIQIHSGLEISHTVVVYTEVDHDCLPLEYEPSIVSAVRKEEFRTTCDKITNRAQAELFLPA